MKTKIFIYIKLLVACSFLYSGNVFSQQAILNLGEANTTGEKSARDAVIMGPGFTSASQFHAFIDENLVINTSYSNPIILNSNPAYSLDKTLEVGTTEGAFNVSLIGAATYDVNIDLPPGTAGMQPSLSVSYNSNAGDGIMGMGWNISSLSAISRVPKTIDPDGVIQEVQFNDNDALALDGNRLVSISSTEYRTSVETFTKITVLSSGGTTYFQAETKDGITIEFGGTADSRLMHSADESKVIAYFINKVSDKNGNYYTYTYFNNRTTGEFRLQKIDYTANDNANISAYNTVQFIYEQKTNAQICEKYYLGSLQTNNVLMREIRISSEGQMFHKYVFNYSHSVTANNPEFIYLNDIQEFGSDNKTYNKTVFNWGTSSSSNPAGITCGLNWNGNGGTALNNSSYTPLPFYGDFNGDGKLETAEIVRECRPNYYSLPDNNCGGNLVTHNISDILWDYRARVGLNGESSDIFLSGINDNYGAQYWVNPNNYYISGTADINGDGKDDAIFCSDQLDDGGSTRTAKYIPLISVPNGEYGRTFQALTPIQLPSMPESTSISSQLLDMDGDGLADLVIKTGSTVRVYYSNPGSPLEIETSFQLSSPLFDITFLDYNGDHIMDFIAKVGTNSYLYVGTSARGFFTLMANPLPSEFNSKLYVADFNNDGNMDVYIPAYKVFQFSTGTDGIFDYYQCNFPDIDETVGLDPFSNYYVGDFNGDGKTDIAFYSLKPHIYGEVPSDFVRGYFGIWFNENFSKGEFSEQDYENGCYSQPSSNEFRKLLYAFPVDADGDGVTEVMFRRYCYDAQLTNTEQHWISSLDVLNGNNYYPTKITKIANGLNMQTSISYKTGQFGDGPLPTACSYPITSSFFPMPVVNYVKESNGILGSGNIQETLETDYKFIDPQTHLRGKGFLGFTTVIESHEIAKNINLPIFAQTTSQFKYNNSYYYPCMTSKTLDYMVVSNVGQLTSQYNSAIVYQNLNKFTISENQYTTHFFDYPHASNTEHFFSYMSEDISTQHYYATIDLNCTSSNNGQVLITDKTNTGQSVATITTYNYPEENNTDSYGNLSSVVSITDKSSGFPDGIYKSVTTYSDYVAAGSWCLNKPSTQTQTIKRKEQQEHIATTSFTWDAGTGRLSSQVSPPGIGDANASSPSPDQSITTTYSYHIPTGSLLQTTVTGVGITNPSTVTSEYDSKYQFVTKQTNALEHSTEASYEPHYGNVISSKNENGLITTYTYDGFGRDKEVITPIGQKISTILGWTEGAETGRNGNCLFFTKSTTSTNNTPDFHSYEYFDMLGRSVGSQATGFDNLPLYSTSYYNQYGQVVQSRQLGPNTHRLLSQLTFDVFGRTSATSSYIATETSDPTEFTPPANDPVAQVSSSYDFSATDEFTFLVTDNNLRVSKKTVDKTGALIRAMGVKDIDDPTDVTVEYTYNSSNQPITINAANSTTPITIVYDKYGRQMLLTDPDAGTSTFKYNSFNQLTEQTDGKDNKYELVYDILGRVVQKKETPTGATSAVDYNYVYDTETHGKGLLASISGGPNNLTTAYKYDAYSRNFKTIETIDGTPFTTTYCFDNHSRINHITYPSGYVIRQYYDNLSNQMTLITDNSNNRIWELNQVNNAGMISKSILGTNGQFVKDKSYTDLMQPLENSFTTTINSNQWCNKWTYSFDDGSGNMSKGNMYSRNNQLTQSNFSSVTSRNLTETFAYDPNDRLTGINTTSPAVPMAIAYNPNGNISSKTDATNQVQDYAYGTSAPDPIHAVKTISPLNETYKPLQKIDYTPFNKIAQIKEGDINAETDDIDLNGNYAQLNYMYGLDNERRKMTETKTETGTLVSTRTKYYSLNYEKETIDVTGAATINHEVNYVFAPDGLAAIYENKDGIGKLYYVATDALGSINMIVNSTNGTIESDMSYDAWGRRRNAQDWTYDNITISSVTNRGFTMHEMLDNFDLINMNGRAYDPFIGQFLSPDPFVSLPANPQGYNRYAYCLNNPLRYRDPSGYIPEKSWAQQQAENYCWGETYYQYNGSFYNFDIEKEIGNNKNNNVGKKQSDYLIWLQNSIVAPGGGLAATNENNRTDLYAGNYYDENDNRKTACSIEKPIETINDRRELFGLFPLCNLATFSINEIISDITMLNNDVNHYPDTRNLLEKGVGWLVRNTTGNNFRRGFFGGSDGANCGFNGPTVGGKLHQAPIPLKMIANALPPVSFGNLCTMAKTGNNIYGEPATVGESIMCIIDIALVGTGSFCKGTVFFVTELNEGKALLFNYTYTFGSEIKSRRGNK